MRLFACAESLRDAEHASRRDVLDTPTGDAVSKVRGRRHRAPDLMARYAGEGTI